MPSRRNIRWLLLLLLLLPLLLLLLLLIIIAFKGAIRDFWQSPHCAANCLQHMRSSGPGAIVCKSRASHRALDSLPPTNLVPHVCSAQLADRVDQLGISPSSHRRRRPARKRLFRGGSSQAGLDYPRPWSFTLSARRIFEKKLSHLI